MSLESATYINGLVEANPLGSDPLSDADGHLRLLKATLKATFPNITGPVTATQAQLNSPFPVGGIILWSGSIATIPTGWLLCNGASGTPDLRDRFVVGAGTSYAPGATGGANTVSLSIANLPSHSHGGATGGANVDHSHTFSGTTTVAGEHSHTYKASVVGTPQTGLTGDGSPSLSEQTSSAGSHSHTYSGTTSGHSTNHVHAISAEGSGTAHENRPPYYALAYIMKI